MPSGFAAALGFTATGNAELGGATNPGAEPRCIPNADVSLMQAHGASPARTHQPRATLRCVLGATSRLIPSPFLIFARQRSAPLAVCPEHLPPRHWARWHSAAGRVTLHWDPPPSLQEPGSRDGTAIPPVRRCWSERGQGGARSVARALPGEKFAHVILCERRGTVSQAGSSAVGAGRRNSRARGKLAGGCSPLAPPAPPGGQRIRGGRGTPALLSPGAAILHSASGLGRCWGVLGVQGHRIIES